MKQIQKTVEIELTNDECQILYHAEKLLREMEREVSMIQIPAYADDLQKIMNCLEDLKIVNARYSVHSKLGINQ